MDFSRITLIMLAQAYGLNYSECYELARNLDCYAKVSGGYILLDKLDIFAESWAKNNKSLSNIPYWQAQHISYIAAIIYPDLKDKYEITNDIEYLREIIRAALLGLMTVPKKDAILFLNDNGFNLKNEVKGISKTFVAKTLDQVNISCQCASAVEKTSGACPTQNTDGLIPRKLWEAREPNNIVNDMRAAQMPEDAIAYVLKNGCAKSKTDIGRIMYPDLSDRSWRGRASELLKKPTKTWKLE